MFVSHIAELSDAHLYFTKFRKFLGALPPPPPGKKSSYATGGGGFSGVSLRGVFLFVSLFLPSFLFLPKDLGA